MSSTSATRTSVIHVAAPLILGLASACALAQSNQVSEFDLLKPGSDSNLTWVSFQQAAKQAFDGQKPVLIYFYAGEKTHKNARGMITAQFRLFPEEDVKQAAAKFICAKVDLDSREKTMEEEAAASTAETADAETPDARGDEAGDEEQATAPATPLPAAKWPGEPAIVLVDYRGRVIQQLAKLPSSSKKFTASLNGAIRMNLRNIALDEKQAAKAAKEKARREAREAEKAERQEKARRREAEEEGKE